LTQYVVEDLPAQLMGECLERWASA
jgi:hypothetical protein